jgi:hypothetical protein
MLRGSRHLGKIFSYSFSPIKVPPIAAWISQRRVGRGDIWRRQWELLENRVYNKPNSCSATGALAPGPDHQHPVELPYVDTVRSHTGHYLRYDGDKMSIRLAYDTTMTSLSIGTCHTEDDTMAIYYIRIQPSKMLQYAYIYLLHNHCTLCCTINERWIFSKSQTGGDVGVQLPS